MYFKKKIAYLFILERGREGEREEEKHNVWLPPACPLLGTWPATQAYALDQEPNRWPLDFQAGTQSTEPHQLGLHMYFLYWKTKTQEFHLVLQNYLTSFFFLEKKIKESAY